MSLDGVRQVDSQRKNESGRKRSNTITSPMKSRGGGGGGGGGGSGSGDVSQMTTTNTTDKSNKRTVTRMIIIKYFEEGDQHAKIIPRTLAYYVKKRIKPLLDLVPPSDEERQRSLIKHHMKECRALKGREIIEMIMGDDLWLQKQNPIHQVMLYNDDDNKFEQVLRDDSFSVFPLDRRRSRSSDEYADDERSNGKDALPSNVRSNENRLEQLFVFHVKRRWSVESVCVQSTMTFSDSCAAEDWVASMYQNDRMMPEEDANAAAAFRYFDVQHNGYTRIYKNQSVPIERTGRTMVKILIEKRQSLKVLDELGKVYTENRNRGLAKSRTMVFNESLDEFYKNFDNDEDDDDDDEEEGDGNVSEEEEESDEEDELENDYGEGYVKDMSQKDRVDIYHSGYSSFVDLAKLPTGIMTTPEAFQHERRLIARWRRVRMPRVHSDVNRSLKKIIRLGVPESMRRDYWLGVTGARVMQQHTTNMYLSDFSNTYSTYKPHIPQDEVTIESIQPRVFANFGGNLDTDSEHCCLTQEGIMAAKRILCVLNDRNQDIDYCPMIPSIVSILLTHLDEAETYAAMYHMLNISRRFKWFFRLNRMDHALLVESFNDLIKKKLPVVAKHMDDIDFDLNALVNVWFEHSFISYLPFNFAIRLIDGFVNEGAKVLYRVGYTVLKTLEPMILKCQSPNYLSKLIYEKSLELTDEDKFFRIAYSLGLRRRHMKQFDEKNKYNIDISKIDVRASSFIKPRFREGHSSEILNNMNQWELIVSWLPIAQRVRKLEKIFTTSKHGYSLTTLYDKCRDSGASLILIHAYPNLSEDDPDNIKYWQSQGDARLAVNDHNESTINRDEEENVDIVDLIKKKSADGVSLRKEILEEEERKRKISNEKKSKIPIPDKQHVEKTSLFGVYCGDPIEKSYSYQGTTDTFLYSLYPVEARYTWSRKNDYFVMGRHDRLVFGGGGDGPGLQFDDMINEGSSYRSLTFENEPLCGTAVSFKILKVEIWAFR